MYKSQHLIMQILNPEAATADQQAGALFQGVVMGTASTAASMAMAASTGGTSAALGAMGGGGGSLGKLLSAAGETGGAGASKSDDKQRYTGK